MRQSDVITWLHDELVDFLNTSSLVTLSTPTKHVDLAEDRGDHPYPFVGIQVTSSDPQSAGIGNGVVSVTNLDYDTNGILQSKTDSIENTLRVTVTVLTDGDEKLRSDLTEDIQLHIGSIARNSDHPSDMEINTVEEATPSGRPDAFVYGNGVPIEIEYVHEQVDDDVTAAETVNVDVDVSDDPTDETPTDSFDETV